MPKRDISHAREHGQRREKAGTGSKVRRLKKKVAGNASQGRGHAIKSRPGSPHGMSMEEDASQEERTPPSKRRDARASAKAQRNFRKNTDEGDGKKKQTHSTSADAKTAQRKAKHAAKAEPEDTKGGRRPPGTKPGRHTGRTASVRQASTTGEAKRRKRTGGGFAGEKRAATTSA